MEKIEIPGALQNRAFKFCLLATQDKKPIELDWTIKNNYYYYEKEIQNHISHFGNYGILGGPGGLIILDADVPYLAEAVKASLPETFTVKTGSGGFHFYFYCPDMHKPIRLYKDAENIGDVQSWGKMAVGPSCVHPNGERYKIVNASEIATVSQEQIKMAVHEWLLEKVEIEKQYSEGTTIPLKIENTVDVSNFSKHGDELQGPHPIHDSKNGNNFCINTEKQVWHCFRCGTGGGIAEWIAVKEGLVPCHMMKRGVVRPIFSKIKKIMQEKYGVVFHDIEKSDIDTLVDTILKTYNIITLIDSDEIFIYDNIKKMYVPNGEKIIKQFLINNIESHVNKNTYNEVLHTITGKTYIQRDDLNPSHLFPVRNGVIDLTTKTLYEHSATFYTTYISPISYDTTCIAGRFLNFLGEVAEAEDIPEIQKMVAYCLLRHQNFQKAFLFVGSGANGKSVLLNVIAEILGKKNVSTLALHDIEKEKFALPVMYGKMANICADLSSLSIATLRNFKAITGGDNVYLERKFKDGFSDKITAKLIFSANEIPYSKEGLDYAVLRRWVVFEFNKKFEGDQRDLTLFEKLTVEEEKSGILNWAIAGIEKLDAEGFSADEKTKKLMTEYGNPIIAFSFEKLGKKEGVMIKKEELYEEYLSFLAEKYDSEKERITQNAFSNRIRPFFPRGITDEKIRDSAGGTVRVWKNLFIRGKGIESEAVNLTLNEVNES
jgi:P4 family phage/plasmid primase-like protien